MKQLTVREHLLASTTIGACGALALIAFPTPAAAQATTCSQSGTAVTCPDGATPIASGFVDANTTVTSGPGFVSNSPTTSTVTLVSAGNGPIHTSNNNEIGFFSTASSDLTVTEEPYRM